MLMRLAPLALFTVFAGATGCLRDDVSASPRPSLVDEAPAATTSSVEPAPALPPPPAPPGDDPKIPMPGPGRKRLAAAVAKNATCEACHVEEAREWRGSYHRRASVDPAYLHAFAIEPSPFCRSCHTPEADPLKEPPSAVRELGVGCVTCHVPVEGAVLAAAHGDAEAEAGPKRRPSPHPVRRSNDFARDGGCAGCHEFRFPRPGGSEDAFFMQTTAREHRGSLGAAKPCAECHMPAWQGRRSHTFDEVRDDGWLRANLSATAERTPDDTLRVTLVQPAPGHDFPTGDLFRRLSVGYEIADDSGTIVRHEVRALARHFEFVPGELGRHLARDDRVESEPRIVEMDLPPPAEAPTAARLSWWVTYQRVATVGPGTNPADALVESEVPLHSGSLPWNKKPAPVANP